MTFNTEKRKIFKIWDDSIQNQFQIDDLSSNDKIILSKINDLNDTDMVYNNVIELSSDWITPQTITLKQFPDFILDMFEEYEVIFNGIDKKLIPYIESKISYRVGDGFPSIQVPLDSDTNDKPFDEGLSDFELNSITEVKPFLEDGTTESDTLKNITYKTSIYLRKGAGTGLPTELQFKFFINIFNPNYYQSS